MTDEEAGEFHRAVGVALCNAVCAAARLGHRNLRLTMDTYVDHSALHGPARFVVDALTTEDVSGLVERSPILQEHTRRMVATVAAGVAGQ